jgi:hypothetical protein
MLQRLAMLAALLIAAPAVAGEPSQLVDTAEFSVKLPAGAERSEQSLETAAGEVKLVSWTDGGGRFAVNLTYADYPKSFADLSPDLLLDGARDGALANVKAAKTKEEKISIEAGGKKYPGRLVQGSKPEGVALTVTLYMVGSRLYQLIAVYPADEKPLPAYQEMVSSFALKPAK